MRLSSALDERQQHMAYKSQKIAISTFSVFDEIDAELATERSLIDVPSTLQDDIEGTDDADVILGTEGDDVINGLNGSDTIFGLGGDDVLQGGGGGDLLFGGDGDDRILNSSGDDTYEGGAGADTLITFGGNDLLSYESSDAAVTINLSTNTASGGHAEGDIFSSQFRHVRGSSHDDTITGNTDRNILEGGAGADSINGGAGDDSIEGGAGADSLDGGDGVDSLNYETSASAVAVNLLEASASGGDAEGDLIANFENVTGSDFNDVLIGDDGDNILRGNGGNDFFEGGAGADTITGDRLTVDTASYRSSDEAVMINLTMNTTSGGHAEGDSLSQINNLQGSAHNDHLTGDGGRNIIEGLGGDDVIIATKGGGTFDGGDGFDVVHFEGAGSQVIVDLIDPSKGKNEGENITFISIEKIIGSDVNDILRGSAGNDFFDGAGDNDKLEGRDGDDLLIGGAGADVIDGGEGVDTASYKTASEGIKLNLLNLAANSGDAAGDSFDSIEIYVGTDFNDKMFGSLGDEEIRGGAGNDQLEGNAGNDFLNGEDGDDLLTGGDGIDTLFGGAGDDKLAGGAGADDFLGKAGYDIVTYATSTSGIVLDLNNLANNTGDAAGDTFATVEQFVGTNYDDELRGGVGADRLYGSDGDDTILGRDGNDFLFGEVGNDTIKGQDGNDKVAGNEGDDTLFGNAGNDKLKGLDGLDTLIGGEGQDILTGGADADIFRFTSVADSGLTGAEIDVITDFEVGVDDIDLVALGITDFLGDGAFTGTGEAEVRYDYVGNKTFLEIDVNGDGTVDMMIKMQGGNLALTVDDFLLG